MKKILLLFLLLTFKVDAISTIVMDMDSGRIIYENDAYRRKLIASTTKIMTFVIASEYGKLLMNEQVTVGKEILEMYGTSIYLNYGEKMSLHDLLYGLILRSGNDAAITIATYIGGNEENFVKLMNNKAKEIGMHNTTFHNCHGLDEKTENYSTAYDMALLSIYANKISLYQEVSKTKYYKTKTLNKSYSWTNRNKLLFLYNKSTGGKTGYTPRAGKTFVSTASNNDLNFTIVSLDDHDLYSHHETLYNNYFSKYKNYLIIKKKTFNKNNKYTKENIYLMDDVYYPLTENEYKNVSYNVNLLKKCINNECGNIEVLLNNKVVLKKKIYYKKKSTNNHKTLFQRIKDFFK